MTDRELMSIAKEASKNAYTPYSKFNVGAALECEDGTVSTICAERTACCKAVSEGHRKYSRIAIYGESKGYCMPCGSCRQFLAEFSPDMEVLCSRADGRYVSYKLSELLPQIAEETDYIDDSLKRVTAQKMSCHPLIRWGAMPDDR